MEAESQGNSLLNTSQNSETISTENLKKPKQKRWPSTLEETLETNHPHFNVKHQVILSEFWPRNECKKCFGTGYTHFADSAPNKHIKIQPNKPCPCGSEKKFKKCCSKRVDELNRSKLIIFTCQCVGKTKNLEAVNTARFKEEIERVINENQ